MFLISFGALGVVREPRGNGATFAQVAYLGLQHTQDLRPEPARGDQRPLTLGGHIDAVIGPTSVADLRDRHRGLAHVAASVPAQTGVSVAPVKYFSPMRAPA